MRGDMSKQTGYKNYFCSGVRGILARQDCVSAKIKDAARTETQVNELLVEGFIV